MKAPSAFGSQNSINKPWGFHESEILNMNTLP